MRAAAALLLAGIAHTFEEDNKSTLPIMDMEFRRNLILLYQEVLNNIVKHSRATRVTIGLKIDDRAIDLRIADNGAGFEPGEKKDGHGLGSLKHRADQMHGVVVLDSSPGSGTTVSFKASLPRLPLVVRFKSVLMKRVRHQTAAPFKP
jgi:signal transduction histidine kinase